MHYGIDESDEICGGLTRTETRSMLDLLKRIRDRGTTIMYVEHDVKAIMAVCDRIVVLNYVEKLAEGQPEEIRNDSAVIEAYLDYAASRPCPCSPAPSMPHAGVPRRRKAGALS